MYHLDPQLHFAVLFITFITSKFLIDGKFVNQNETVFIEISKNQSNNSSGMLNNSETPATSYLQQSEVGKPTLISLLHPNQLMNSTAACEAFTNGTSLAEFASPNFPRDYPDNIDCIKIITAPMGHVVLVQFFDYFNIEAPSENIKGEPCAYDYLEIRAGKFGYSPNMQKICGQRPPAEAKSSGRYLWLKFHSDSTVSYKGFRATVHFLLDMSPTPAFSDCVREISGVEGEIISKNEIDIDYLRHTQRNKLHIDCTWVIQTEPGKHIYLRIPGYALEHPNNCNYNKIEIYTSYAKLAGKTVEPPTKLCGSLQKSFVSSEDHVMAIRLVSEVGPKSLTDDMKKLSQFKANYTVMRTIGVNTTGSDNRACAEDEFDCSDQTCIDISLKCNNRVNCALKNDEEKCPDLKPEGLKADIFIISFLGCLLVLGMCTGMFLNIFRKLRQDRTELDILRANQRKSRESGIQSLALAEGQSQKSGRSGNTSLAEVKSQDNNYRGSGTTQIFFQGDSSNESKETVLERPITGHRVSDSTKEVVPNVPRFPQQEIDTELISQPIITHQAGFVIPTPQNEITYSPSIGYTSARQGPGNIKIPQKTSLAKNRRASSSDIVPQNLHQEVVLYKKPSELALPKVSENPSRSQAVQVHPSQSSTDVHTGSGHWRKPRDSSRPGLELENVQTTPYVQCIEVRDCSCQTRESYLMSRRKPVTLVGSTFGGLSRRPQLARTEGVEFQETPIRRVSRGQSLDQSFYPCAPSSSASSEIGRSLERLDEEFE